MLEDYTCIQLFWFDLIIQFKLIPSTGTTRSFSAFENKVKESGQKNGRKGKRMEITE